MNNERKTTRIASVQKALKVLDFIASNPNGLDVKDISKGTKINTSTCYHILNTLVDEDYLIKKSDGLYVLGVKIPRLNNTFMKSVRPDITLIEELSALQKKTGETVYLLGVKENHIIMQAIIEGVHAIKVNALYEGYSGNYHARASTKVILAHWDETEIDQFFRDYDFVKISEKTPLGLEQLKIQLKAIRNQGYCLDEEETAIGVCFIAAPIFYYNGKPIGSFALSVPTERYVEKREELIEFVVHAAAKASKLMGYAE